MASFWKFKAWLHHWTSKLFWLIFVELLIFLLDSL